MSDMTTYEQYQIVSTYDAQNIQSAGLMPQGIHTLGDIFREQNRLFGLLTPTERRQDLTAVRIALGKESARCSAASHR